MRIRLQLRMLREMVELTQIQVAKRLRVSQSSVCKLEQSTNPTIATLLQYCKAVGAELNITVVMPKGRRFLLLGWERIQKK